MTRIEYDRVADLFTGAFLTPTEFLPEWEEWRALAGKFRLDRRRTWPILATAVAQLISAGPNPPSNWLPWIQAPLNS